MINGSESINYKYLKILTTDNRVGSYKVFSTKEGKI